MRGKNTLKEKERKDRKQEALERISKKIISFFTKDLKSYKQLNTISRYIHMINTLKAEHTSKISLKCNKQK